MRQIIGAGEQVITDDGILFPEVAFILQRLMSIEVINLPNLKSFFHGANFEFHMPALKEVKVQRCGLLALFTLSMFRKFQLETLDVRFCESLDNIVEDLRGDETCDKIITLFQLRKIEFSSLPNLKSFFHNANYEFHMPVLTEVLVYACGFSNTLFKRPVFRNFKQLDILNVSSCRLLEGIFEDTRGDETFDINHKITLSRLSSVRLKDLPELKSFLYSSNYECNMPALRRVSVVNCGLSTLFPCSGFRELQQLKDLEVVGCRLLERIAEYVRGDETSDTNGILFPKLKFLKLVNLPSLTSFLCYESGKANTCKVAFRFLQLWSVVLQDLPDLKSFFHGANFEFQMPAIEKVEVHDCGLSSTLFTRSVFRNLRKLEKISVIDCEFLEGIFEDVRCDETLDTSDKFITLNRVSMVHLQGLPKFKSIFCGATYECYMPALKNVKIVGCGLSILFTSSVFREIQQLQKLHVSNCESLEQIVEEVGDETSEINGKSIIISQLSSITLESLPNLKSFSCTSSYVFNMPKLQYFRLMKCPQIEYFSSSKTNTSLVRVTSDWCSEEGLSDLNDFIRQNHIRGSYSSDRVGESSYSSQELGTQSKRIEEEKPQETETDQPDSSV